MQLNLIELPPKESDIVYTPKHIAQGIIDMVTPQGTCLDPCLGDGSFYNCFTGEKYWCELRKGKNFFDFEKQVDWIIGNPPYSIFEDWLIHSFRIAENVVYILPTNKVFQRQIIMRRINQWGGIKAIWVYGSGSMVGFPFGFSVGTFHFLKDYKGECSLRLGI